MKKALVLVVLLLAVFIGAMLMNDKSTPLQKQEEYISVTSFSLFEISNKLIGEHIKINKLIPYGLETHSYIPSVKTMTEISKSKFFIYNGLGIEPWIKKEYDNAIDMSQFMELHETGDTDEDHADHEEDDHHHGDEGFDPHYWLDIENMIRMTSVLSEKFGTSFPEHKT